MSTPEQVKLELAYLDPLDRICEQRQGETKMQYKDRVIRELTSFSRAVMTESRMHESEFNAVKNMYENHVELSLRPTPPPPPPKPDYVPYLLCYVFGIVTLPVLYDVLYTFFLHTK